MQFAVFTHHRNDMHGVNSAFMTDLAGSVEACWTSPAERVW